MEPRTDPDRAGSYLRSLAPDLPQFLADLEEKCFREYVSVIRKGTQSVIRCMLALKRPERILEIGTGIGFSASFMAEYSGAEIITIEHAPDRIREAGEVLSASPHAGRIRLIGGEAEDILPKLTGTFDLVFMDAAKGQYGAMLHDVLNLLAPGGLLITDNVLQEGSLIDSHYLIERRDRTIHKRMREYLETLMHHPELTTTILTEGDGMALSVKYIKKA